jgi:hypothetical protein
MRLDPHPILHNYNCFALLVKLHSPYKKLAATATNKKLQVQEKELVIYTLMSKYYFFCNNQQATICALIYIALLVINN